MQAHSAKSSPDSGVAPPTKPVRQAAGLMFILTTIYLVWELAFNARLLDVIGDVGDFDQVEALEVWGRLISGAALALVYLGARLGRHAKTGWTPQSLGFFRWTKMLITCAILMTVVFFGQKWIIDQLVNASTAEARRRAAVLVPMTSLVKAGQVQFPSLQLGVQDFESPQGKTFLATLPLQTMSHPDLFTRIEEVGVDRLFGAYAQNVRGSAEDFHQNYLKSVSALEETYRGPYQEASRKYQNAIGAGAAQRKAQAWADYERRLAQQRRGLRPNNVPRMYWARVRNDVVNSGVPVPKNWAPSDRATFNAAMDREIRERALNEFRMQSRMQMGVADAIDPGLSLAGFLASQGVAQSWRASLSLPDGMVPVPGLDVSRFERVVYEPTIAGDVKRLVKTNYAKVEDYERGRPQFRAGERAYRALIVPPVALVFSLMGAMTHIFKIVLLALKIFRTVPTAVYWGSLGGYFFLMGMIPLLITNNVTQQRLFKDLEGYTSKGMAAGPVVAAGVRWATQFQPFFYPVNEFARTRILSSPKFDHQLFEHRPAKQ